MLRHKVLWDSWMARPDLENALIRHETRLDDRFVPITLPDRGKTKRAAAMALGARIAG